MPTAYVWFDKDTHKYYNVGKRSICEPCAKNKQLELIRSAICSGCDEEFVLFTGYLFIDNKTTACFTCMAKFRRWQMRRIEQKMNKENTSGC